jgi:hypothetical protein
MLEREGHLALVAAVGPISRVQQQVGVEAVLAGECLAAVRAHVGPLACVNQFTLNIIHSNGPLVSALSM